ncbi:MAG: hypothetical protein QOH36_717 [Actinomycetota bacterium]|nr:hypothetical protein [Actinomycetota bacterium]
MLSVVAMLYVAGTIGFVIGARDDARPGEDSLDVQFLQDMISHHEQAIQLSNLELTAGVDAGIRGFAREILTFQAYEIGIMEGKLAEWGRAPQDRTDTAMAWMDHPVPVDQMPGMASEDELRLLRQAAGAGVDALFVPLMQDHHRGGVHMADYAAEAASDPVVRALAARMVRNQRVEIGELDAARQRAGLDPTPEGYVPAEIPADPADPETGHEGHGG